MNDKLRQSLSPQLHADKKEFSLLRELLDYMTPLYIVAMGSASPTNLHYVAIPPDSEIEEFLLPGPNDLNRVVQAAVRSHIFHGKSALQLNSLGGCSAEFSVFSAAGPSPPVGFEDAIGLISVRTAQNGHVKSLVHRVERAGNSNFVFLFVDASLHQTTSLARRSVASIKTLAMSNSQPLWQRVPCSATRSIRKSEQGTVISADALAQLYKADELSFRHFVVEFANEKEDELLLRRLSHDGGKEQEEPTSIREETTKHFTEVPESSARFQQTAVHSSMDAAMMQTDTEVAMFLSSYVIMDGFEDFTVSKVQQIVETVSEIALGIGDEDDETTTTNAMDDCDVTVRGFRASNSDDDEGMWSEEDHEQIIVAFHSIVTGSLSSKIIPHWEDVGYNEDFAFYHACNTLQRTAMDELRCGFETVTPALCAQVIELVKLLDSQSLSVFSYMRIMETAIAFAVDVVTAASAGKCDVTADICIPLIVFIVACAAPQHLPSRIRFVLDFSIPVLEMSSLGYALTTFEAATAQLLEEYRQRVAGE